MERTARFNTARPGVSLAERNPAAAVEAGPGGYSEQLQQLSDVLRRMRQ